MDDLASSLAVITIADGSLRIAPRGMHRLSSMVRRLEIPLHVIESVQPATRERLAEVLRPRATKRKTGTQIGDRYRAGAFQYWKSDVWSWFLLRKGDRAVELVLFGHRYQHIVVAVDDPEGIARAIEASRSLEEVS